MTIQNKKIISMAVFFGIFMILGMPHAFAESASVTIPSGSSTPGCEATNTCFDPYEITINVGDEVTWTNDDTAAHTVTAGTAADGPSGVFDSSLFMAGTTFSHTFDAAGDFPYFCMVHPWMAGIIHVGSSQTTTTSSKPTTTTSEPTTTTNEPVMNNQAKVTLDYDISSGKVTNIIADGNTHSVILNLDSTDSGEITVTLPRDIIDSKINGADDEFFVLVNNEETPFDETKTSSTDRTLTIQYPAGTEKIEIIGTFAVPEFGTIAAMILAIAIISTVVISKKTKLSVIPRA